MGKVITSKRAAAKQPVLSANDPLFLQLVGHDYLAPKKPTAKLSAGGLAVAEMAVRDISKTADMAGDWLLLQDLDCMRAAAEHRVDEVLAWLKACSAFTMASVPYRYTVDNGASDGYFGTATWHARAFAAYKMVRVYATPADQTKLDTWFIDAARWHAAHMDDGEYGIGKYFPGRMSGDYTPAREAATGARMPYKAHADAPEQLSVLSVVFNNRRAACWFFAALVGIYFKDPALIAGVKRYIPEWVKYSVHEDGSQGDWVRNESNRITYGYNSGGCTYSSYSNAMAVIIARMLSEMGDDDLLQFRTRVGMWGTEAKRTAKSIFTPLETHMGMFDGSLVFKDSLGVVMNQRSGPSGLYLNHITWCLPAVRGESRFSYLGRLVKEAPKRVDDAFGAWRGFCGAWLDVRLAN